MSYKINVNGVWFGEDFVKKDYKHIFEKDPEFIIHYLKSCQNLCNDILKLKGFILLNKVLEIIGLPATKNGDYIGWYYDLYDNNRDNYVDFGIYDLKSNTDFIKGLSDRLYLQFNYDGEIRSYISKEELD